MISFILIPVPDIVGYGEILCEGLLSVIQPGKIDSDQEWPPIWMHHPSPLLPDMHSTTKDERVIRRHYYLSLLMVTFIGYSTVGLVATWIINRCKSDQSSQYTIVKSEKLEHLKGRLRNRRLVTAIVFGYITVSVVLLEICSRRRSVDIVQGAPWEFWVLWFHLGLFSGLVSLATLSRGPLKIPLEIYPKRMLTAHLVIASEKVDTAKDLIFVFSIREHFPVLAAASGVMLMASQIYFLQNTYTLGELLESYLPILTAGTGDHSHQHEVSAEDQSCSNKAKQELVKHTSPARYRISLFEDFPQACAMLYVAYVEQIASQFVIGSLAICMTRLALSHPWLGGRIAKSLVHTLRVEREKNLAKGNAPKVLSFTRSIWSVTHEFDPAPELKMVGFTAAELVAEGISPRQLILADYNASELKEAEINASDLKREGLSARDLKRSQFSATDLDKAEFSADELIEAGYSLNDIKHLGHRIAVIKNSGRFKLSEFIDEGYSLTDLKQAGFNATELKDAGFSADDLKKVGFNATELKEAGFSADELKGAGFGASDLIKAGTSLLDLKRIEFTTHELKDAGLSLGELKQAGCSATDLKNIGFSALELKNEGFSLQNLHAASFTAKELIDVGFSLDALKSEGFSAIHLKNEKIDAIELSAAGFTLPDLKAAGFSVHDLKKAKFSLSELTKAGFTATELQKASFSASDLKKQGFSIYDLQAAGFTDAQLTGAGFTIYECKQAHRQAAKKR